MNVSRQQFTAVNQVLHLAVLGNAYVGIGVTGTFVGTVSFYGSYDGSNWTPLNCQVYPWVQGGSTVASHVQASGSANGQYVAQVIDYRFVKATVTVLTSGNPVVSIASSIDGSYAAAYQSQGGLWRTSAGFGNNNTLTAAANTNHGWKLKKLMVSISKLATQPQVTIKDGATAIAVLDIPATVGTNDLTNLLQNYASSPGNNLSVGLSSSAAGGGGASSSSSSGVLESNDISVLVEPY